MGYSYAGEDSKDTWPVFLREFTNSEVVTAGYGGASNYSILQQFKVNWINDPYQIYPHLFRAK